jgi:hypothetical protein
VCDRSSCLAALPLFVFSQQIILQITKVICLHRYPRFYLVSPQPTRPVLRFLRLLSHTAVFESAKMVVFDNHEILTAEEKRLREDRKREKYWKKWGPYVAERQWATGKLSQGMPLSPAMIF